MRKLLLVAVLCLMGTLAAAAPRKSPPQLPPAVGDDSTLMRYGPRNEHQMRHRVPEQPEPTYVVDRMARDHDGFLAAVADPEGTAAVFLRERPVPAEREAALDRVLAQAGDADGGPFTNHGWSLAIVEVVDAPGGWVAEVLAWPMARLGDFHPTVTNHTTEHYRYAHGVLTYLGGTLDDEQLVYAFHGG